MPRRAANRGSLLEKDFFRRIPDVPCVKHVSNDLGEHRRRDQVPADPACRGIDVVGPVLVFRAGKDLLGDGPWMLVAPIEGLTAFSEKVSAKNVPKPCDAVLPEGFRRKDECAQALGAIQ